MGLSNNNGPHEKSKHRAEVDQAEPFECGDEFVGHSDDTSIVEVPDGYVVVGVGKIKPERL
jgi:hypothetical protein